MSILNNLLQNLPQQPICSSRFSWQSGIGVAELSDLQDIRCDFRKQAPFEVKSEKTGKVEKFTFVSFEIDRIENELISINYASPSAKIKLFND